MKTRSALFGVWLVHALTAAGVDLIENAVPAAFWNRAAARDGPLSGYVEWQDRYSPFASEWDKTDFWAAIAVSPTTRKFAASCAYISFDGATRAACDKCDASDARAVVVCANGWCALALDGRDADGDFDWGVGWGPDQRTAERFAIEAARNQGLSRPKVVYSIDAREPRTGGAIAFSESTGRWGYSTGGGLRAPHMAMQNCGEPDARIIAQEYDGWLALAVGDDKGVYGWGSAGNRRDAERNALAACGKRTRNARIVLCFCTNGVSY